MTTLAIKDPRLPSPEKFNTFNTFNTFAIFDRKPGGIRVSGGKHSQR